MAFSLTLWELFDIIVMVAAAGFIFMHLFKQPVKDSEEYDPLSHYSSKRSNFWEEFKIAAIIAGPAVVLHEISHKIAAVSLGIPATIHAPYWFLALAILLVLIKFPIIFFVAGYVSHGAATLSQTATIAIAGPLVNLILWVGSWIILNNKTYKKKLDKKTRLILNATMMINMFMFIFNMLPIPGFDGYHFFISIGQMLF